MKKARLALSVCIFKYCSHIIGKEELQMIKIADNVHES